MPSLPLNAHVSSSLNMTFSPLLLTAWEAK
jgi:hypothetical protein